MNQQTDDTRSEAGQSSECATDVSHSSGIQPSPPCPTPPITDWQSSIEVPYEHTESDDDK